MVLGRRQSIVSYVHIFFIFERLFFILERIIVILERLFVILERIFFHIFAHICSYILVIYFTQETYPNMLKAYQKTGETNPYTFSTPPKDNNHNLSRDTNPNTLRARHLEFKPDLWLTNEASPSAETLPGDNIVFSID